MLANTVNMRQSTHDIKWRLKLQDRKMQDWKLTDKNYRNRSYYSFGIEDCALAWFRSYLSDRSYCVVYGGVSSQLIYVMCSVPQGSVLGPLLFIL